MLLGVRFVYASRRSVLLNRSITYANRFKWSGLLCGRVITGAWTAGAYIIDIFYLPF
jgi:hypothetical protein